MKSGRLMTSLQFEPAHPKALAIYCSDGRFTNAVEEILHSAGHPRIDVLTLPGGPGLFNRWTARFSESEVMEGSSSFLIRDHAIKEVVLMAHAGCGFYQKRFPVEDEAGVRRRQLEDLRVAENYLLTVFPGLKVTLLYGVVEAGKIAFEVL